MGRGLSELQKTILEMAYERFVEEEREENERYRAHHPNHLYETGFDGIEYTVYVGQVVPTADSDSRSEERMWASRIRDRELSFEKPDWRMRDAVWDEVYSDVKAEEEKVEAKKREVEEKVRAAAPEWWEEPEDAHYVWSPPRWRSRYSWGCEEFEVASFYNNAAEARRYQRILDEKKLPGGYWWYGGGSVYTGEILERVYGFEPRYKFEYWPWGQRNAIKFDPEKIGESRYNAARASVSRALKRLYDRLLIEQGYGYATITVEGIAELTGQSIEDVCRAHKINRTDGDNRLLVRGERERTPSPKAAEAVAAMQDMLNPRPPTLSTALFDAIVREIIDGTARTEEAIREAFEDALRRVKEATEQQEEAVKESVAPNKD